jgi:ATP-dependent Clp protease ATP-binding subunit ClpA
MVRPTRAAAAQLSAAAYEALKYGQREILSSHFLLALVRSGSGAAADLLRSRGLEYERLSALMREHRFILPREETALPKVEDLLGPLGEQLARLYGQAGDNTRFLS